jgi:hypothetical protein
VSGVCGGGAPFEEAALPARRRIPAITGAAVSVLIVVASGERPLRRICLPGRGVLEEYMAALSAPTLISNRYWPPTRQSQGAGCPGSPGDWPPARPVSSACSAATSAPKSRSYCSTNNTTAL